MSAEEDAYWDEFIDQALAAGWQFPFEIADRRGHPIICPNEHDPRCLYTSRDRHPPVGPEGCNLWHYLDGTPVETEERPCVSCYRLPQANGYDACVRHIDGAAGACCGHGAEFRAYLYYVDGTRYDGEEALERIREEV